MSRNPRKKYRLFPVMKKFDDFNSLALTIILIDYHERSVFVRATLTICMNKEY